MAKVTYQRSIQLAELEQILDLQARNLKKNLDLKEISSQGFVTVVHDIDLLSKLNEDYPHVIAKSEGKVIAYALIMLRKFEATIPVLKPMFEQINLTPYHDATLGDLNYFIMGQVCIDKAYRGQGIFANLYLKLAAAMQEHYDYIITEVAFENKRSLNAHRNIGFKIVLQYEDEQGTEWCIVLLSI